MATERDVGPRDPEKYELRRYQLLVGKSDIRMLGRGPLMGPYPIDYDMDQLEARTLDKLVRMLRENRVRQEETELLGEYLYRLILNNEIGAELHRTLAIPDVFLRVELVFEDAKCELANLPWEYLFNRDNRSGKGYFLATKDRLALVRSPRVENCRALPFRITATDKQLRVLIVACSPSNLPALDFEALLESVQTLPSLELKLLITKHTDSPAFATATQGLPEATHDNLIKALTKFKPHVVHFLGHGKCDSSGGRVAFADDGYLADWRTGGTLANALSDHASVRLAFLQACESAVGDSAVAYRALSSVAGDLVQTGIPAIVAMQAKVENAAANSFAETFYRAVIEQRQPIYRAMQLARTQSGEAACIPVLYLGQDKDGENVDGLLFPSVPGESTPTSPNAIGATAVPIAAVCPWCNSKAECVQEADQYYDCCGNPTRCLKPGCGYALPAKIRPDQNFIYCRKCRQKVNRYVEAAIPAEPQSDRFDSVAAPTKPKYRDKVPSDQSESNNDDDNPVRDLYSARARGSHA